MTLIIILNVVFMALVFAGILALLSAGILSNRRWAAALSGPASAPRRARPRAGAREAAGRPEPRRQYVPAR
jgi:hypothetical protein